MKKITLVTSSDGDWEGLYINGNLITQDHHITIHEMLAVLGYCMEQVVCDDDWLNDEVSLPNDLEEVVRAR